MSDEERILDVLMKSYDEEVSLCVMLDSKTISSLCDSNSEEIRVWLARALAHHNSDTQAVALLRKLSQDRESCVRVEVVDSLSGFANQDSFDILCNASMDEDELVRAYAAFGVALVGKRICAEKALQTLWDMAQIEKNERTFVNIYEGLYMLGRNEMLEELMRLYNSSDYRVQCATLNALDELVCSQNLSKIKEFVSILDTSVCVPAVAYSINRLAQRCHEINYD